MGSGEGAQRESPALVPVLLSAVVPGVPTYRRNWILGSVLFAAGVVFPLAWLILWILHERSWVALGLDRRFLGQLVAVLVIVVVVAGRGRGRGAAVEQGAAPPRRALRRRGRGADRGRAAVLMGADTAVEARADIGRAFQSAPNAPIYDAADQPPTGDDRRHRRRRPRPAEPVTTEPPTSTTSPDRDRRSPTSTSPNQTQPPAPPKAPPDSGVDPAMLADVSTILLLGGDAGPGRSGLRTDSMILVSVHRPSGRAALISVPRNLEHLLFPPGTPLAQRYPNGFDDIANAVYPRVSSNNDRCATHTGSTSCRRVRSGSRRASATRST